MGWDARHVPTERRKGDSEKSQGPASLKGETEVVDMNPKTKRGETLRIWWCWIFSCFVYPYVLLLCIKLRSKKKVNFHFLENHLDLSSNLSFEYF